MAARDAFSVINRDGTDRKGFRSLSGALTELVARTGQAPTADQLRLFKEQARGHFRRSPQKPFHLGDARIERTT